MKKFITFLVAGIIIFSSCVSEAEKERTISLSGAFALYPMVIKWAEEYKKENEDLRFNISAGGAGKGMTDALSGTVELGMFSREIEQTEKDKGVWWVGLCKDAVLPTVSADNPYLSELKKRGISQQEFRSIFIEGSIRKFSDILSIEENTEIQVYTRSDACGAAGTWAKYLGGKQEDLIGVGIHGDPALAEAVAKDSYGFGFNNTAYIYDINTGKKHVGIEVIPIDLNNNGKIDSNEMFYDTFDEILNAISKGDYPSPARELYFVAAGKPQKKAVIDFIEWILTDGQKYIKEAGYVPISRGKLDSYLNKIK